MGICNDCHEGVVCVEICIAAAPVGSNVNGITSDGSVSVNQL